MAVSANAKVVAMVVKPVLPDDGLVDLVLRTVAFRRRLESCGGVGCACLFECLFDLNADCGRYARVLGGRELAANTGERGSHCDNEVIGLYIKKELWSGRVASECESVRLLKGK